MDAVHHNSYSHQISFRFGMRLISEFSIQDRKVRMSMPECGVCRPAHCSTQFWKIDMSLPESQIRGLQAGEHILTTVRRGGNTNMDQSETEGRRQAMTQRMGRSVNELAARDAVKSATTFTTTEDDRHLDVIRQEEFEEAGKILDDYSDRSAIASIEVINDLDYQPTSSEQSHWRKHNPGAFSHIKKVSINGVIKQHLLVIHAHKQNLKIILGLSIKDAHSYDVTCRKCTSVCSLDSCDSLAMARSRDSRHNDYGVVQQANETRSHRRHSLG